MTTPRSSPDASRAIHVELLSASREGLLRKYQELLAKHEKLVHRLELRNDEYISTHRLSAWAMETSASALALINDGVVLLANHRWHDLSRSGPWYRVREGRQQGTALLTLRQIAEFASQTLNGGAGRGPLMERYQEHAGIRTLEVRTERVGTPTKHRPSQGVLVLAHDITSQVQAEKELELARATLSQQEHLRALGELASGVAHDLNNTLNAMKLRLELIEKDAEFVKRHRAHLDALARIVSDASTRIRHLQDFARQRPEPMGEQVQLADIIQEAVEIARGDLEHRAKREGVAVRVEVELPPLPRLNGSATDLRYVFINLVLNARDAMPRGGTILVRGRVLEGKVLITVEDEGTGISEAHLRSLFRPFFTTKGRHGTGLGLSMAYGVMARAGGSISAGNRPEGGAIFTLTFPTEAPAEQQAPVAELAPEKPAPRRAPRPPRSTRSRRKRR